MAVEVALMQRRTVTEHAMWYATTPQHRGLGVSHRHPTLYQTLLVLFSWYVLPLVASAIEGLRNRLDCCDMLL